MGRWVAVAAADACPPGACLEVVAGDRIVALFHPAEGLCALDGVCPHQGGPLGKGQLDGTTVTCPWHGWQFDVQSGQHRLSAAIRQPRFEVRVEAGQIQVWLEDA